MFATEIDFDDDDLVLTHKPKEEKKTISSRLLMNVIGKLAKNNTDFKSLDQQIEDDYRVRKSRMSEWTERSAIKIAPLTLL